MIVHPSYYSKLKLKNDTEILEGQVALELLIKIMFCIFDQLTQEALCI